MHKSHVEMTHGSRLPITNSHIVFSQQTNADLQQKLKASEDLLKEQEVKSNDAAKAGDKANQRINDLNDEIKRLGEVRCFVFHVRSHYSMNACRLLLFPWIGKCGPRAEAQRRNRSRKAASQSWAKHYSRARWGYASRCGKASCTVPKIFQLSAGRTAQESLYTRQVAC